MGWSNHLLTYPFTKLKESGRGPLEEALKRTSTSQADLFANGTINPAAKYKAVCHASVSPLTIAQRKSVHFGLGSTFPVLPTPTSSNSYNPHAVLTYTRPTIGNYPLRTFDFIKDTTSTTAGYDDMAVWPLAFKLWDVSRDYAALSVFVDQYVNSAIDQTQRYWYSDRSLSIADLFDVSSDPQSLYDKYIAFFVINVTSGAVNLVKMRKRLRDVVTDGGLYNISLFTSDKTVEGRTCPRVPVLYNAAVGNSVRVIMCLATGAPTSGYEYSVTTSSFPDCISLEFEQNWDRGTETMHGAGNDIAGITTSVGTITITRTSETVVVNNVTWRKFIIDLAQIGYNTSGVTGGLNNAQADVDFRVYNEQGRAVMSQSTPDSSDTNSDYHFPAEIRNINNNQSKTVTIIDDNLFIWFNTSSGYTSATIKFQVKLSQAGVSKATASGTDQTISIA